MQERQGGAQVAASRRRRRKQAAPEATEDYGGLRAVTEDWIDSRLLGLTKMTRPHGATLVAQDECSLRIG